MLDTAYDPDHLDKILPTLEPERKERGQENHGEGQLPPVRLDDYGKQVWRGEIVKRTESEEVDRSRSLLLIGRVLYDAGATRETTVAALKQRDVSLGWDKYADRKDDGEYHEIVNELEAKGLNNVYSLESRRTGPAPRKSSFRDRIPVHDIIENGVDDPEELVQGVLLKGKVHQLFSEAASGKSWVALGLAREAIDQSVTVVYVDKENGSRTMAKRLESLGIPNEKIEAHFHYLVDPVTSLDVTAQVDYEDMLDEVNPHLVVFDSWIGCLSDAGLDENVSSDIQKFANGYLHPARKRGITVLILDHVPHDARQRARGSGRKKEEVDVQWELHKSEGFDRNRLGKIELRRRKDREGWLPDKIAFRLGGEDGRFVFEREGRAEENRRSMLKGNQEKVLKVLEDKFDKGATNKQWEAACKEYENVPESSFYHAKNKLLEQAHVEKRNGTFVPLSNGTTF